jgi:inner membrane protein YidH
MSESTISTEYSWLRTRMSVERTLLSWNRTAVSLIGFGFTIYQFFLKFQQATAPEAARPQAPRNFGLALIGAGVVAMALALWQHRVLVKELESESFGAVRPHLHLPVRGQQSVFVTVILLIIGVAAFGWILLGGD